MLKVSLIVVTTIDAIIVKFVDVVVLISIFVVIVVVIRLVLVPGPIFKIPCRKNSKCRWAANR